MVSWHPIHLFAPQSPLWPDSHRPSWCLLLVTPGAIEVQPEHKKDDERQQCIENESKRPPNHYLWAMLLARIYNLFPLLCPESGAEMRVIAVIQDKPVINKILRSMGEAIEPPS